MKALVCLSLLVLPQLASALVLNPSGSAATFFQCTYVFVNRFFDPANPKDLISYAQLEPYHANSIEKIEEISQKFPEARRQRTHRYLWKNIGYSYSGGDAVEARGVKPLEVKRQTFRETQIQMLLDTGHPLIRPMQEALAVVGFYSRTAYINRSKTIDCQKRILGGVIKVNKDYK